MSNDTIKELIDNLRLGKHENPTEQINLLAAALMEDGGADVELILSLLKAPQTSLRQAAAAACNKRSEAALLDELRKLVNDPSEKVREAFAAVLSTLILEDFQSELKALIEDYFEPVRYAAIKSSSGNRLFITQLEFALANDDSYRVRLVAAESLNEIENPAVATSLYKALANEYDDYVQMKIAEMLEQRLMLHTDETLDQLPEYDTQQIERVNQFLQGARAARFPLLTEWSSLHAAVGTDTVDLKELAQFGTDLTALALEGTLPRAHAGESVRELAMQTLFGSEPRSLVLLGDAGVGKSALINELVYDLLEPDRGGWRVLRVSPTDIMVGTKFLGEWESRVGKLVSCTRRPRKVLLYIPNLSDLSMVGKTSGSESNAASALAPYIEDGSVLVIGESTPAEYEAGLGSIPSLSRLFKKLLLMEATPETTKHILARVRDDAKATYISDELLEQVLETSEQFLGHCARPGNAIGLLRDIIAARSPETESAPITRRTILDSVSRSTGIPADFLDDSIALDLAAVRQFLAQRVIGQPEAVEAVTDLVTLIKAGLTDPAKPFGVLFFIGPTGVGKTELARAIAEYVFGDAGRLQRFDMSEFASQEGFERLIGVGQKSGLLTDSVRQKPFSVVLLDEIEKSHINVFDLCLQLFDAGRLTDGRGRTIDFRRTIIIMTSNIGAVGSPSGTLGFAAPGQQPRAHTDVDRERTMRELSRVFRPEFLNRIDRIINFRPLSLEVAESIARREVNNVLQRSGIVRRNLSIDVDPSAIALLVKEGYSPSFGARPLKRAVERVLLLPLATAIATGRIAGKTVLRLSAVGDRIEVKKISVPDDVKQQTADTKTRTSSALIGLSQDLVDAIEELEQHIQPLADRKSQLLHEMRRPDFYQDQKRAAETFDEIHKLDQFVSTYAGLEKVVNGIRERLAHKVSKADEAPLFDRLQQLAAELDHLRFVATSRDTRDLSDVIISVKLVDRTNIADEGVETLVRMYSSFAQKRRLSVEMIAEHHTENEEVVYMHIVGLGAYALFKNEVGLHQLENRNQSKSRHGKEKQREDRQVIRIDVLPVHGQPDKSFLTKLRTTINRTKSKSRYVKKATHEASLFHEPSLRSFQGLLTGEKDDALAKAQLILYTWVKESELNGSEEIDQIVRHYDLGSTARVKDARSGKTTTRVEQVLKGNLDLFLSKDKPLS